LPKNKKIKERLPSTCVLSLHRHTHTRAHKRRRKKESLKIKENIASGRCFEGN
jgi:hypothetical protein